MDKGVIIHLDDKENVFDSVKHLLSQTDLDLDYIPCQTKELFEETINIHRLNIKCLIFDLLSQSPDADELNKEDAFFLEKIEKSFSEYNIPIFIYSGYLQALGNKYLNSGTIICVDKGEEGPDVIIEKISLLYNSGFIDVFCPNGILEVEISKELNKSFTKQFIDIKEIESIIKSIQDSSPDVHIFKERVKNIFKRVAVRNLTNDLIAPIADNEDTVHPIEHFYRRQSQVDIWTGDIWCNNEGINVLILTPRCNCAIGSQGNIIYCFIEPSKFSNREIPKYVIDNILAKSKRYIPSSVFFPEGGMVNLANHETKEKGEFLKEYKYKTTLSDDLTNEILGKFAYYFLRTGITNINTVEMESVLKTFAEDKNEV